MENQRKFRLDPDLKLMDQVRQVLRYHHYADRTTLFPKSIQPEMRRQLEKIKRLHDEDPAQGYGGVYLPEALARKYPYVAQEFRWQYVFLAKKRSVDPRTGVERRHHVLESGLQKAVKVAVDRAGITKRWAAKPSVGGSNLSS